MQQVLALGIRQKLVLAAATLLTAFVIGGWALASGWVTSAAAVGEPSSVEMIRSNDANKLPLGDIKPNLVGSYRVTGTDADGQPYAGPGIVDISLTPSGALELDWDNGKNFGIGQVIGNVLAVSSLNKGRTMILIMQLNPDGSLSGKWSRRTDRGYKGTETWKKTS
jgi:hypothetical protein